LSAPASPPVRPFDLVGTVFDMLASLRLLTGQGVERA
jgi:hypothetical protein